MGVAVNVHVVAAIVFFASQRDAKSAMLGNPAGLDRFVNKAGHNIIDPIGQKLLHRVLARIVFPGGWNGEIEVQCPTAHDLGIVIKAIDDQYGDIHLRAAE